MGMSQEEIDRLMAEMTAGVDLSSSAKVAKQEPGIVVFHHSVSLLADSICNIVPILIGESKVVANTGQAMTGSLGDLTSGRQGKVIFFSVKEPALTEASFLGWIDTSIALHIGRRMMGQEDESGINEVLLSALNEAFGNIFGAFDASLKEDFKLAVEHSDLKLFEGDASAGIQKETGLEPTTQVCMVPVAIKIGDIAGGVGLLIGMNGLDELLSKHPSLKQEAAIVTSAKSSGGESEQVSNLADEAVGRATVPFETRRTAPEVPLAKFEDLTPHRPTGEPRGVELILDVPLSVSVELGRKKLSVKEILDLVPGSLVELDKLAGENVDLFVNGKLFAKGEVVVIDENFGVRVASILTAKERVERLR